MKDYKFYTPKQDKWLKENAPTIAYKQLCKLFNKRFGEQRTESSIQHRCQRLGIVQVVNYQHQYTKEQDQWLMDHYENNPIKDTCQEFNKRFGLNISSVALSIHCCKRLHIKAKTCNYYTEEENEWLKINYPLSKGKQDIYKKFCERFGNYRSANSVLSNCINKLKLKRYTIREKWELEHGKIPKNCYLTDLGNGEYMVMEKSISHYLCKNKLNKKGEITKTFYEIIKAQRLIGKINGKSIQINQSHNIAEWCKNTGYRPPIYHKLNQEQVERAKELRNQGLTYKAIGKMFNVDGCTISNYLNGYIYARKNLTYKEYKALTK